MNGERSVLAGIFVGGGSTRMGRPKGLLFGADGRTLVERWAALFAQLNVPCVLVGRRAEYAQLGVPSLPDAEGGAGPLAGVVALLRAAHPNRAVAVACDMPRVPGSLIETLLAAPAAACVAPRRDGVWEPFLARYDTAIALPVAERRLAEGRLSLQGLLDELGAHELRLAPEDLAHLVDWDSPEDLTR